ncbi:MAG: hypothetical protein FWH29_00955 [Methanobrevibacter sp.]|nr:hypothetical protein [Methanobrevibacter sp.]
MKISFLIIMTLLVFFCVHSASASNLTNSTEGGISQGISNISSGGTLNLADGIYSGVDNSNITIDKDVTIVGSSKTDTIIYLDSGDWAFNVSSGNTLTLYNLTIISNYFYSDDDIADFNSPVNKFNGSIDGPGFVVFDNCNFINNEQTNAIVTVNASSTYPTNRIDFEAYITDLDGNNLNGDLAFYINNQFSGRVPISNGIANYGLDIVNGTYVVHASYIGNGETNLKISQNQISFTVASLTHMWNDTLTGDIYYVARTGNDNNPGTFDSPKLTIGSAYSAGNLANKENFNIIIQPETYSGTGNQALTIGRNVTIIGNDTDADVIIRPGSSNFISTSAGTATNWKKYNLYNLKINCGASGSGTGNAGTVQFYGYSIVNIDSVEFNNITGGRAIAILAGNVNFTINNSKILNIYLGSSGAAIQATGGSNTVPFTNPINIYNCIFDNLGGSGVGAVIRNFGGAYGTITIVNSSFNNCYSTNGHGGIFCSAGDLIINNTNFTDCRSGNQGGVLYSHGTNDHNFTNTRFINCSATNYGGALVAYGAGPINLDNCTFIGNVAGSYGGAVVAQSTGTITVKDSYFENNQADSYGGAVVAQSTGTITVKDSYFENNQAGSYGGAVVAYASGGRIDVDNSGFENNHAGTYGGAVASAGTITVNNSNFNNNNAIEYGGAVGASAGTITVRDANFSGNYVYGSTAYGGALGTPGGTINAYNSEFFNNSARNNSATAISYGGVAGVNGANAVINLNNSIIHGNWAKYGGAFSAGSAGGRINVNVCPAIFNNYALDYGGVVGLSSSGTIVLQDCNNIYNNSAGNYGGVFGVIGGTINVTDSEVSNNHAGNFGGVVGINGVNGVVNIFNSEMNDNFALNFGGVIGATGGTVNVRNSSLKRNKANGTSGYGGAIGLTTGTINVYDSEFMDNIATDYGGAVGVPSTGTFYANNSNFTSNEAIYGYGGAIGSGAGVNIAYCIFTDNIAGTNGGAVAAMAIPGVTNQVYSCQFEFNRARGIVSDSGLGNAIYAANYLTANYNRFFNNSGSSPGVFTNTLWTNTSQNAVPINNLNGVNVDYNWWGDNNQYAIGHIPNNYVVVNISNPNLWNGSAHYTYTITTNDSSSGFNVNRLPPFWGDVHFSQPFFEEIHYFTAHANGTVITLPFTNEAIQNGYFQIDNQLLYFDVRTNSTPKVTGLTVDLGSTSGKYTDDVSLTANFTDNEGHPIAGLLVHFYVAEEYVGNNTTDDNGFVSCGYNVVSAGNLTYNVVYNGENLNYNPINESTILEFFKLDTYIVVNSYVLGNSGVPVILNATLYDEKNRTIENFTLRLYSINGSYYTFAVTDSSGKAIANYTFPVTGNYTWYGVFEGNGNYTASNSSTTSTGTAEILPVVNLTITKTSNATSTVRVGDSVVYTIVVHNYGPDTATGVIVHDQLDYRLIYQSHSGDGTYNNINGIWNVGNINSGDNVTLTITVIVNGSGDIPNFANITDVNENNNNNGNNISGTNVTTPSTVNFTMVKSVNVSSAVNFGDIIAYTIVVTNHGPDNATNFLVSDFLDPRLAFESATNGGFFNGSHVLWNGLNLNLYQSMTLTLLARVRGTGNISNTATVSTIHDNVGVNSSNIVNFTVSPAVNLTITKKSNVTSGIVAVGDLVTYTITIHNHGPDDATGVTVFDELDPRFVFESGPGYNTVTKSWTGLSINSNSNITLTITVRVVGTGTIGNFVNVSSTELNIGDNTSNIANVTVPVSANISINKTSNVTGTNVTVGDLVTYTITIANYGPNNATGVLINDKLDSRLIFISSSSGNYNPLTGVWNIGNLNVGDTLTLTIVVRVNGTGNIFNVANVSIQQTNIGNNSSSTNFTLDPTVNLTIAKTSNVTTSNVTVGNLVTYTITITNHGPDNATGVMVNDKLDSRLIFISSSSGNYNHLTGVWNVGTIANGNTVTLNIIVSVNGTGTIPNVANVTVNEINIGENSTNGINLTLPPTVNLTITKTSNATGSNVTVGDLVTYTITLTNHGPDNGTNVVVNDILDHRLIYVGSTGSPDNYDSVTGVWNVGFIEVYQTLTLTITVRVNGTGNIPNVANVSVSEVNIGDNTTTGNNATLDIKATVNLTISKTSNSTPNVIIGDLVVFTITLTNHGPDDASGLRVTDFLDSRLVYVSSLASQGSYTSSTGTWDIGNLALGQSANINITVRIMGNGTINNIATVRVDQDNVGEDNASSTPFDAYKIPVTVVVENVTQNATIPFIINGSIISSKNDWIVNGTVDIIINGTTYTNVPVLDGKFNLYLTYNVSGNYSDLIVVYLGDNYFEAANTSGYLNILPLNTTINVDTSTDMIYNYSNNISALVLDQFNRPVVGATITFYVEGINIGTSLTNSTGVAIIAYTPIGPVGSTYFIEAVYGGNSTFNPSNNSINLTSRLVNTKIIIDNVISKPFRNTIVGLILLDEFDNPLIGETLVVTIGSENHTVVTSAGGRTYISYTPLEAGDVFIFADFTQKSALAESNESGALKVEKIFTSIEMKNVVVNPLQDANIVATLVDEDGRLLANRLVDIYVNGEFIATFDTDSYGRIFVSLDSLPIGNYPISAILTSSDNIWEGTSSNVELTVRPIKTSTVVSVIQKENESTTFIARLFDEFNKPLANKWTVFYLNGQFIGLAETDSNGVATLHYSYTIGGRIEVEFLGDNIYRESLDNRPFDILSESNNSTNSTNNTNDTKPTDNTTDPESDPIEDKEKKANNGKNGDNVDGINSEDKDNNDNAKDTSVLIMLISGSPIAMVLLCLLSIFIFGFRSRKKI